MRQVDRLRRSVPVCEDTDDHAPGPPQHGAKWELAWLPLGPLAASGACVYVSSLLADTEKEVG